MTDLSKGILDVGSITLSQNTTASDFDNVASSDIKVEVSKRGHTYVKFLKPLTVNAIDMYVEVACYSDSDTPEITLYPVVPPELNGKYEEVAKHKVEVSKRWLKGIIQDPPTSESCESILFSYDWGYIRSATREDIHYGLVGGEITIRFGE